MFSLFDVMAFVRENVYCHYDSVHITQTIIMVLDSTVNNQITFSNLNEINDEQILPLTLYLPIRPM